MAGVDDRGSDHRLGSVAVDICRLPSFADRGYLFSKPLGLLIVATIAWLFASFSVIGFNAITVGIGIVLLALGSFAIFWKIGDEIVVFMKANWKTIAVAELIFLVAFLAFLAIRLANPDLWHAWRGGEKTDGLRLSERHHTIDHNAALRSMVRRWISQLLLLWPVHRRFADPHDWNHSIGRIQLGGTANFRADCDFRLHDRLQLGRHGDAGPAARSASAKSR